MKKILVVSALAMLTSQLLFADALKIDMAAFEKAVAAPSKKEKEQVLEVIPVFSSKAAKIPVVKMPSVQTYEAQYGGRSSIKEETRENFIKSLRSVLEKGQEFKYYFPNFDYAACKKEVNLMMKDAVAD